MVLFRPLVFQAVCVPCGLMSAGPFCTGCQEIRFAAEGSICLIVVRVGGAGQSCEAPGLHVVWTSCFPFGVYCIGAGHRPI